MDKALLTSLLLLLILPVPLLFLQRFVQREIQAIFLLLTRQPEISVALFSLLFFPGVLLHEVSHYLMAHLLGVKTGRFSIIPRNLGAGRLRLGYVETASTDFIRDALIGAAPLLTGGVFVAFAGISRLQLNVLWQNINAGQSSSMVGALKSVYGLPDFWLWFYLTFTVSSTMMPSASDRRAWAPILLMMAGITALVLLAGIGPWLLTRFGSIMQSALQAVTVVFAITILIHLVLLLPAWIIRKILSRILGVQVV
ncbi:MAG: hypothetical protein ACM3H7_02505 [Acidobacteriaceae bacterium]